jgi:hypothetical protein
MIKAYGYASNYFATNHPSLPNYLAFASGSDQGQEGSDGYNPSGGNAFSGDTFADSLRKAGIAWKHYSDKLPSTDYLGGDTSGYVQHHDPWVYFATRSNFNKNIVAYTQLSTDLSAGTAPPFFFVQPTNANNGHSGSDSACDNWVQSAVALIQGSTWYTQNSGKIILWWDEAQKSDTSNTPNGDGPGGGKVMCVVISEANKGKSSVQPYTGNVNHYGLLHALEKLYSVNEHTLPYLLKSANAVNGDLTPMLG